MTQLRIKRNIASRDDPLPDPVFVAIWSSYQGVIDYLRRTQRISYELGVFGPSSQPFMHLTSPLYEDELQKRRMQTIVLEGQNISLFTLFRVPVLQGGILVLAPPNTAGQGEWVNYKVALEPICLRAQNRHMYVVRHAWCRENKHLDGSCVLLLQHSPQ